MPGHFFPQADALFDTWQANLAAYVEEHQAELGAAAATVAALLQARAGWEASYPAHVTAQSAAREATQGKNGARQAYRAALRALIRQIQASPSMTDEMRAAMGITVPDRNPTRAPEPASAPILSAAGTSRLQVSVGFRDGASGREAKPDGVLGCEIWMRLGSAPRDLKDCELLGLDTASPYVATFAGELAGQWTHFIGRWVSTRGAHGPVSATVSVTVPG